ncbi:DUF3592 domain-containing protein [bacterium]|nr:DUF3592 domain-containing protein [bacterium]
MNAKPISESGNLGCLQTGFVVSFGLIFFLSGMAVIVTQVAMPWFYAKAASDWQQVPCKITSFEIEVHHGDETKYSPEIEYQYTVAGQTYQGSLYDFNAKNRGLPACQEIKSRYPEGKPAICFVDPEDANNAVLDRTPRFAWPLLILGGIFSAIGAAVAFVLPFALTAKQKIKEPVSAIGRTTDSVGGLTKAAQANSESLYPEDFEDQKWDKPQRLKPATTKIGSLLGLVALAAFWNGIVFVLAFAIFGDGLGGVFSIFFMLFLIPFVLIGLLIILGAVKSFLALFNPVVEIALSTGAIARGSEVDIAWEVKGNAGRIHRLQIAAVGTETAQYSQGTNTRTETSDFGIIPIVDSTESDGISFGSVAIKIPQSTMHTFSDTNNKVTWAIEVRGEIRRWPDVFQTHSFRVKP